MTPARIVLVIGVLLLTACATPRPQRGGSSAVTPVSATVIQPENPQGETRQTITREWLVPADTTAPVVLREQAQTIIGGSQSQADIIRAAGAHRGALFASFVSMLYLVLGYAAWKREWPTVALGLVGSGVLGIVTAWTLPFLAPASLVIGPCIAAGIWFAYRSVRTPLLP